MRIEPADILAGPVFSWPGLESKATATGLAHHDLI